MYTRGVAPSMNAYIYTRLVLCHGPSHPPQAFDAAAAAGPGGEGGNPKKLYKAPTDCTKPRQTIQNPNRLYKAQKNYTKPPDDNTKTSNTRQNQQILDKDLKYLTSVATNSNSTIFSKSH